MDPEQRRDLARRHRLRHQLRHAPGAHQPHARRGPRPKLHELVDALSERVPAGVGRAGFVNLDRRRVRARSLRRARAGASSSGYGRPRTWSAPRRAAAIAGADPARVSAARVERGHQQIGTLGSGNHYLEIQVARPENVFDARARRAPSASTCPNQVVVMFHCGSRGFGHQVATDYLQIFLPLMTTKYGIAILDRELACAPFRSPEGPALLRRHEVRRQHVVRQPPGDPAPHPRGVRRRLRARRRGPRPAAWSTTSPTTPPSWRRTRSTGGARRCSCTARAPRAPSRPGMPDLPAELPRDSASR